MSNSFIDGRIARLIALAIVLGCAFAVYMLNARYAARQPSAMPQSSGAEAPSEANLNPEFVKCRDERVGQVEKMFSEGVIGDDKLAEFRERAIATCAGQFPPGG